MEDKPPKKCYVGEESEEMDGGRLFYVCEREGPERRGNEERRKHVTRPRQVSVAENTAQ